METQIVHRSKIGLEILAPIILVVGTVTTLITLESVWLGIVIGSLFVWFFTSFYAGTNYRITNDNRLIIKCGIIETIEIAIDEIEWIKKSNEFTSAPALSIDRLEIGYKGGRVLISPRNKKQFVADLKKINPKIWWTN